MPSSTIPPQAFQQALLAWYAQAARPLPWRQYSPPDAYRIWLAEIMLQQTTVAAVIPYYHRFLEAFPTVQALANADITDVLHLWQGLGYYRRAHLLHACAKAVVTDHNGNFPTSESALRTLPGLGPYTAAAVAALAFNQPASVVDGNVERVISRLFRITTPLPKAKAILAQHAASLASPTQPRAYANAIMELGATVCPPTSPKCDVCPVAKFCAAKANGDAATFPRKAPKKTIPHLTATAYVITDAQGRIHLHQRPAQGMMAGLWEVPTICPTQPNPADWPSTCKPPHGATHHHTVTHTFSHFKLTVDVFHARGKAAKTQPFEAHTLPPLSSLMRKILSR